jgi:hypothetical protein
MIHRRSRISRFPEPIVKQINEFLDANTEYARIIDWLTEQGHPGIEHYHISRWRESGYQDWLQSQEQEAEFDRKMRWVERQATQNTHVHLHKAAMSALALKLFDAFHRFDSVEIDKLLESKPEKILTLVNSFARYSHEVLEQQRFSEELRALAAAEAEAKAPRERISDDARRKVYEELRVALRLPASIIPPPVAEPHTTAQTQTPEQPNVHQ